MKNELFKRFFLPILIAVVFISGCKEDNDAEPELLVSVSNLSVPAGGGNSELTITSSDKWRISNPSTEWVAVSQTSGSRGTSTIQLDAVSNITGSPRTAILTVTSDNGQARRISLEQPSLHYVPEIYPSYNVSPQPPDMTGMSSTAVELAAKMHLGWNIGNTFEAPGGETGWGSPVITEDFIKFIKQQGFNAIRLPCAWDWHHVDDEATARINESWMNRVKEVIEYCVNNDMYVLLNIHWDGGWLENNCTPDKKDAVNAKQKAYWEQIATAMRDFDEHLMFASANEPNADNATKMGVLLSYHQTFVDAVRSTGGRNAYRVLVIQGSHELLDVSKFPNDPTPDRMMYEEHNYTPSQFCFLSEDVSWGNMAYYWGKDYQSVIEPERNFTATWGDEDAQIKFFQKIKTQFIDKGIPVLMGEYGAYRRDGNKNVPKDLEKHHASVDHWATFVTKQAIAHGVIPFWWDTGGALDRASYTLKDKRTIDAIVAGSE
jgi:endoglucanase